MKIQFQSSVFCAMVLTGLIGWQNAAGATEFEPAYKVTLGTYSTKTLGNAFDINVRGQINDETAQHTAWVGRYQDQQGYSQFRSGYEYVWEGHSFRPTVSTQIAAGGFLGGALTSELGPKELFAVAGVGRTNLRNYYNLTFDPNDMIQYGLGWRPNLANMAQSFSLFRIADNRLGTGQAITHFVWRDSVSGDTRITMDMFLKQGAIDTGATVHNKFGAAIGLDEKQWFIKLAYDPNVNFTAQRQRRLSFGLRF
jgi:hypothetical protein